MQGPYPNPAKDLAQLRYELEEGRMLDLRLVDGQGRVVRNLFTGQQTAGPHALDFSVADLSAGIYFLQFRSGNGVRTKALRVVR